MATQSRKTNVAPSTRSTRGSAGKGPDAIVMLREDHKKVSAMFSQYDKLKDKGTDTAKRDLVQQICQELRVHTTLEEEIFYPAARAALGMKGEDLLDEAEVEHGTAKDLITELESAQPTEELYDARVTVLGEYIKHHVKEEQDEMFTKCRTATMDLKGLGAQLAARRGQLTQ